MKIKNFQSIAASTPSALVGLNALRRFTQLSQRLLINAHTNGL
jgi:hypothetical protein